jgi:dTDP-4-dehydrorhamnose 3,5-epimerase
MSATRTRPDVMTTIQELDLPGVVLLKPAVFGDERGWFKEAWHQARYAELGLPAEFRQDNVSHSRHGVLRGLHYQHPNGQGKLVSVLQGSVYDVAVDIRPDSPAFGRWVGHRLDAETHEQMYIPPGFAHGFVVLSESALFAYKCTAVYDAAADAGIRWDDPEIGIRWPVERPSLSAKDLAAPRLRDVPPDRLPRMGGAP